MKTIKGPALFLAQFAGDEAPFNAWASITRWAAGCGYPGVQVPFWDDRAGRFRSPGDGQVDFGGIFSKLTQYGFDGWAAVEGECCLEHPEDGTREGAAFVDTHILRVTEKAFDDFADAGTDVGANRRMLGLE